MNQLQRYNLIQYSYTPISTPVLSETIRGIPGLTMLDIKRSMRREHHGYVLENVQLTQAEQLKHDLSARGIRTEIASNQELELPELKTAQSFEMRDTTLTFFNKTNQATHFPWHKIAVAAFGYMPEEQTVIRQSVAGAEDPGLSYTSTTSYRSKQTERLARLELILFDTLESSGEDCDILRFSFIASRLRYPAIPNIQDIANQYDIQTETAYLITLFKTIQKYSPGVRTNDIWDTEKQLNIKTYDALDDFYAEVKWINWHAQTNEPQVKIPQAVVSTKIEQNNTTPIDWHETEFSVPAFDEIYL